MASKGQPTSVRFSNELKARLKRYALPRGWPVAKLIEFIVKEWLDFQERREKKK